MTTVLSEDLIERIDVIPDPQGWWHGDGVATFYNLARDLLDHGYTEDEACDFLEAAFGAAAGEFGV